MHFSVKGLPGYTDFLRFCGFEEHTIPRDWNTPPPDIDTATWNSLRQLYARPADIDLFTAGVSERAVTNGVTGRTFTCLKVKQFKELKDGDRYFFTHSGQSGSMSTLQVGNLKSRTLGDIICDNTGILQVKENVFLVGSRPKACVNRNRLNTRLFAGQTFIPPTPQK